MIVEEVISKEHTQTQPSAELGPIEKRIMEQKQRVNPFKKSSVVSTTFEVRQSKRERKTNKAEREDKKRVEKEKEKEQQKLARLRGELGN